MPKTRMTAKINGKEYQVMYEGFYNYKPNLFGSMTKMHRMEHGDIRIEDDDFRECASRMKEAIRKKYQL